MEKSGISDNSAFTLRSYNVDRGTGGFSSARLDLILQNRSGAKDHKRSSGNECDTNLTGDVSHSQVENTSLKNDTKYDDDHDDRKSEPEKLEGISGGNVQCRRLPRRRSPDKRKSLKQDKQSGDICAGDRKDNWNSATSVLKDSKDRLVNKRETSSRSGDTSCPLRLNRDTPTSLHGGHHGISKSSGRHAIPGHNVCYSRDGIESDTLSKALPKSRVSGMFMKLLKGDFMIEPSVTPEDNDGLISTSGQLTSSVSNDVPMNTQHVEQSGKVKGEGVSGSPFIMAIPKVRQSGQQLSPNCKQLIVQNSEIGQQCGKTDEAMRAASKDTERKLLEDTKSDKSGQEMEMDLPVNGDNGSLLDQLRAFDSLKGTCVMTGVCPAQLQVTHKTQTGYGTDGDEVGQISQLEGEERDGEKLCNDAENLYKNVLIRNMSGAGHVCVRDTNFINTVPADGLAPGGARPSAGAGLTARQPGKPFGTDTGIHIVTEADKSCSHLVNDSCKDSDRPVVNGDQHVIAGSAAVTGHRHVNQHVTDPINYSLDNYGNGSICTECGKHENFMTVSHELTEHMVDRLESLSVYVGKHNDRMSGKDQALSEENGENIVPNPDIVVNSKMVSSSCMNKDSLYDSHGVKNSHGSLDSVDDKHSGGYNCSHKEWQPDVGKNILKEGFSDKDVTHGLNCKENHIGKRSDIITDPHHESFADMCTNISKQKIHTEKQNGNFISIPGICRIVNKCVDQKYEGVSDKRGRITCQMGAGNNGGLSDLCSQEFSGNDMCVSSGTNVVHITDGGSQPEPSNIHEAGKGIAACRDRPKHEQLVESCLRTDNEMPMNIHDAKRSPALDTPSILAADDVGNDVGSLHPTDVNTHQLTIKLTARPGRPNAATKTENMRIETSCSSAGMSDRWADAGADIDMDIVSPNSSYDFFDVERKSNGNAVNLYQSFWDLTKLGTEDGDENDNPESSKSESSQEERQKWISDLSNGTIPEIDESTLIEEDGEIPQSISQEDHSFSNSISATNGAINHKECLDCDTNRNCGCSSMYSRVNDQTTSNDQSKVVKDPKLSKGEPVLSGKTGMHRQMAKQLRETSGGGPLTKFHNLPEDDLFKDVNPRLAKPPNGGLANLGLTSEEKMATESCAGEVEGLNGSQASVAGPPGQVTGRQSASGLRRHEPYTPACRVHTREHSSANSHDVTSLFGTIRKQGYTDSTGISNGVLNNDDDVFDHKGENLTLHRSSEEDKIYRDILSSLSDTEESLGCRDSDCKEKEKSCDENCNETGLPTFQSIQALLGSYNSSRGSIRRRSSSHSSLSDGKKEQRRPGSCEYPSSEHGYQALNSQGNLLTSDRSVSKNSLEDSGTDDRSLVNSRPQPGVIETGSVTLRRGRSEKGSPHTSRRTIPRERPKSEPSAEWDSTKTEWESLVMAACGYSRRSLGSLTNLGRPYIEPIPEMTMSMVDLPCVNGEDTSTLDDVPSPGNPEPGTGAYNYSEDYDNMENITDSLEDVREYPLITASCMELSYRGEEPRNHSQFSQKSALNDSYYSSSSRRDRLKHILHRCHSDEINSLDMDSSSDQYTLSEYEESPRTCTTSEYSGSSEMEDSPRSCCSIDQMICTVCLKHLRGRTRDRNVRFSDSDEQTESSSLTSPCIKTMGDSTLRRTHSLNGMTFTMSPDGVKLFDRNKKTRHSSPDKLQKLRLEMQNRSCRLDSYVWVDFLCRM